MTQHQPNWQLVQPSTRSEQDRGPIAAASPLVASSATDAVVGRVVVATVNWRGALS